MENLFLKILNMGLTASFLILAVVILRFFLKKAPRWIVCLLWALVAFKLICPFSLESALSLVPSNEPLPEKILTGHSFEINTGIGLVDAPVNAYLGGHYYEGVTVPADNGNHIMHTAGVFWALGAVLMLLYGLISYYRLYRITRVSVCAEKNIYRCDLIDTPFILGIIKPRICLPSDMDEEQAAYVTAHERAHLKRRDHWWKPAGFLILSVYWFQPLCWISYILLCRDIELACDEKVIADLDGESKKAYAEALLSCSIRQNMVAACPLAFGETGVKERVKNVLHYKKPAFWIVLTAVLCGILAAVFFMTNPKEKEEETAPVEETAVYMEDVLMRAEWYAKAAYQTALENSADNDYVSWRVRYCEKCYTYDDLKGKTYELYRFDYEFLSAAPENVALVGGMSISEDGWVVPDYPDSRYLVYEKEEEQRTFVTMLFENDCMPGDEVFTEDLLAAIKEAAETAGNLRNAEDTEKAESGEAQELLQFLADWQSAFCGRDGEAIAGMVTKELAEEMLSGMEGNYSFGVSSPWPWDSASDSMLYDYDEESAVIYYYAMTSDPHVTCWREELEYVLKNDRYVITKETLACYDNISAGEEFENAYPLMIVGTMMDYTANGLGKTLNENALLSSSMAYRALFEPESAAAFLLNLSDDPEKVRLTQHEPEGDEPVWLTVTFPEDEKTFKISMLQPFGKSGIWVPVDYRADVIARMREVGRQQWRSLAYKPDEIPDLSGILCIGEIPEEKIRVYGYNDEDIIGHGVAIEFEEIRSGGVREADSEIYYYDWYYVTPRSLLPKLYWDEAKERLQMSCLIYTGTGAAAEELHILQRYGTMQDTTLSLEDYRLLLEERIDWSFEKKERKLILTDRRTGETLAEAAVPEDAGYRVTELELGLISGFELGDQIRFTVSPGYYMDDMYGAAWYEGMPDLTFELLMTQGKNGRLAFALGERIL